MLHLAGYHPGDNLTVMNVMYERQTKDPDTGRYGSDYAHIVFKDNNTGLKHVQTIKDPKYTYYLAKEDVEIGYNMAWIESDKVYPVTCNYRDIKKSIAEKTHNLELFKTNISTGNYKLNDSFYAHPRVFGADMNILNYLRMEFAATYQNPVSPATIAYYDIENDIIDALTDEVNIGESPINVASIYFDANKTVYSFVLRNSRNPQIEEFEKKYIEDRDLYTKKINDFIVQNIGSVEKTQKYRLENLNLRVGFFDSEEELIVTFFQVMKKLSPDFAVAYNSSYDLRYLTTRAEVHGLDVLELVSDEDFSRRFYYYFVDMAMYNDYENRKDYVMMSSKTTWLDQMIIYASRRKGQNAISSFSLDNVAATECGVRKLDWHHITNRFALFAYTEFETFWLYNINDTIVQACLEAQTEDLQYVFNNVIEMNTPYQKIFRQTNYLASKGMEFYKEHEGVIMGANINRFSSPPNTKFPGAYVARPEKLTDKNKERTRGFPIMKFSNANDFDYKALYPSLMREFNMSSFTQIGMIQIENPPYKPIDYLRLGAGGHFSEDIASYNFIQFAHRWLNLPNVEEMLKITDEYFKTQRTPSYKNTSKNLPMDKSHKRVLEFVDPTKVLVFDTPPMPKYIKNEVDRLRREIQLV